MTFDFNSFNYYPNLRTRPAEVKGYSELAGACKDAIIPVFTLGAWPRQDDTRLSLSEVITASGGRPIILDLTSDPAYLTKDTHELKNPSSNFKEWREFIERIEHPVIPVIQINEDSKISQVIRQARHFENTGFNKLAFKINSFSDQANNVIAALSALDSADNALVIIDAGYIRDTLHPSLAGSVALINAIREEVDNAIISVTSTSFPSSVMPFVDPKSKGKSGVIDMLETKLFAAIGREAVIYGDHGSIHSRVYPTKGGKFIARIDYPLNDAWVFERRADTNSQGYISAAEDLIENCPEILEDYTWGARKIVSAANSEIDNMKQPASWIAARVNMHISRQIDLTNSSVTDEEDFDDLI
ncbi:beta family protein [Pseudomonas qingdaonensis]|uniref:beta family protein n=1 Tax=Pseudomonas qingdaonensis TaxID=2056231 RepID=UPI0033416640